MIFFSHIKSKHCAARDDSRGIYRVSNADVSITSNNVPNENKHDKSTTKTVDGQSLLETVSRAIYTLYSILMSKRQSLLE
jgi:hypothetical protein